MRGRAPVPDQEDDVLKALLLGACALVLLVTPTAAHSVARTDGLEAKLRERVGTLEHDRQVIAFFANHEWLLSDARFGKEAKRQLWQHRTHVALSMRRLAATRAAIARDRHARSLAAAKRRVARKLALAQARSPQAVICRVFGGYCGQALAVAQCESGLSPRAQNGQYVGLFQMGSSERHLFGHGSGAEAQTRAAHRYFVRSGRDWSPWSCKPW